MADPFPLYLPPDAPRLFQTESLLRRIAQTAAWDQGSHLLELFGSLGGLALARALGCRVTVMEPDPKVIEQLRERATIAQVIDRVTFVEGAPDGAPPSGMFEGVFTFSRVLGLPGNVARTFRPLLATRGRLGFLAVAKVGRTQAPEAVAAWERRLGTPLRLPRELLLEVEREGFEPDLIETASESELDQFYTEVSGLLEKPGAPTGAGPDALKAEIALHRDLAGSSGVTLGFVLARRKEPGEKPPLSRDSG